jgi:hypothetical protein
MPPRDWRRDEDYQALRHFADPDLAWECLRRNADYRADYRRALSRDPAAESADRFQHWGLRFRR